MIREFWIELKNMCAWEINEKPTAHRESLHVIEKTAHDKCQEMLRIAEEALKAIVHEHTEEEAGPPHTRQCMFSVYTAEDALEEIERLKK